MFYTGYTTPMTSLFGNSTKEPDYIKTRSSLMKTRMVSVFG